MGNFPSQRRVGLNPMISMMEITREEATRLIGSAELRRELEYDCAREFQLLTRANLIRFHDQGWRYLVNGSPKAVKATEALLS